MRAAAVKMARLHVNATIMRSLSQAAKFALRHAGAHAARFAGGRAQAASAAPRARRAGTLRSRHAGAATNFATRRLLARHRTRRA
jgi:hypothetical protein